MSKVSHLQMLLTADQVAALAQVSRRQVQRWIADRLVDAVYVTETDVRIPAADYERFLAERTVRRAEA